MKTNLKISLVAGLMLAAGLAYSQAPGGGVPCDTMGPHGYMQGYGMSHRGIGRMDPARIPALMDKRHAALKVQLKLSAAQEPAWTAFVDSHKPTAAMTGLMATMPDLAKLTTPERIDKMKELRAQHLGEMSAAMDKRGEATKAFYAVLTPDQQKVFDAQVMMGQRHGHGPRGGMRATQLKL
ncbi:Spy/CpxP family protein refolding chaperone [Rhodoferax sp.]|uniref:Spy/CpxP family protein refolding chaperone n=1 Tax=Rhodoferax sp. TaxID=50421 RepID=UPI0025EDFFF3|nr:Spy/CpxP family protein refolding chaperone [Rhodoferax sp.]MCM2297400.1 Spy/CpxP family protein refolding chaperone [Rhodoferax sp.]